MSIQFADARIQASLVSRVRQTGSAYYASPACSPSSGPLDAYLAALEALAGYVAQRSPIQRFVPDISTARDRLRLQTKSLPRQEIKGRILPFAAPVSEPLPAA